MARDTEDTEFDDVPEAVGLGVVRCEGCGMIHIGLLDENEAPICEMTLEDADVLRIAMQLMLAVFPDMQIQTLMERITAVAGKSHARRHH